MDGRPRGAGQGQRRSGGRAWREACGSQNQATPHPTPAGDQPQGGLGGPRQAGTTISGPSARLGSWILGFGRLAHDYHPGCWRLSNPDRPASAAAPGRARGPLSVPGLRTEASSITCSALPSVRRPAMGFSRPIRGILHRAFRAGLGLQASDRLLFPRYPRNPRAAPDPRLILGEFPDLVGDWQIGPGPDVSVSPFGVSLPFTTVGLRTAGKLPVHSSSAQCHGPA